MSETLMKVGTRGSRLALRQTQIVVEALQSRYPGLAVETTVIRTKGDILQDVSLAKVGGKGLFVKEIEEALLRGEIDFAVHSMKDVPVLIPDALEIAVTPEREDVRDVLVARGGMKLEEMPPEARIGTGSLRRRFQLSHWLPDAVIVPLRGNLDTRIRKIEADGLDGVVVAAAGMKRMGWVGRVTQYLPVETMLPAIGQGAVGIETRRRDEGLRERLAFLHHAPTAQAVGAERSFLRRLGGGCQLPVAAYAVIQGGKMHLRGLVGSLDGRTMIRDEARGSVEEGLALGNLLAERILSRGGQAILDEIAETCLT